MVVAWAITLTMFSAQVIAVVVPMSIAAVAGYVNHVRPAQHVQPKADTSMQLPHAVIGRMRSFVLAGVKMVRVSQLLLLMQIIMAVTAMIQSVQMVRSVILTVPVDRDVKTTV